MEIKGTSILVTGANRGIGKAFVKRCAKDHPRFYFINRTSDPHLNKELLELGAESVNEYLIDLTNRQALENLIGELKNIEPSILFNNAGLYLGDLLEKQDMQEIDAMLEVNVRALITLTRVFLPGMLQNKRGKIINHSSSAGILNLPMTSTYAASKAAVHAFTESLNIELKGTGVSTLTLLSPGVDTSLYDKVKKTFKSYTNISQIKSVPVDRYADLIREAVLLDEKELRPDGLIGLSLFLKQHWPRLFSKLIKTQFKREI